MVVLVGVSTARRAALVAENRPVPVDIRVDALVDTGASCTCVDPHVLSRLGLSPTGTALMQTPSTGDTPIETAQYDVGFKIITAVPEDALRLGTVPVVASDLFKAQGFSVLLGRDILSRCLFQYDGMKGTFTFAY